MMKKSFYETPEAELLLVKFEENILSGDNEHYSSGGTYTGGFDDEDGQGA